MRNALIKTVVLLAAASMLTGCAVSAQPGSVGVVVDDYAIIPTPPVIMGCIPESTQSTEIVNNVYFYPARDITYDAKDEQGAERGPIVVVSNREAATEMKVPVTVRMTLTSDCELLKEFHRRIGTKYSAWTSSSNAGLTSDSEDGWVRALNFVVGDPLQITLTRAAQQYGWRDIWNNEAVRLEFEHKLNEELPKAIKQRTSSNNDADVSNDPDFFTNISISVLKPEPARDELKNTLASEQANVAKANSAKSAADAQVAQARAETIVAEERAKQQRAVISGYPTVDDYLRSMLIDKGGNPYQPTWIGPR